MTPTKQMQSVHIDEDLIAIANEQHHIMRAMLQKLDIETAPQINSTVTVPDSESPRTTAPSITLQIQPHDAETGKPLPEAQVAVQRPEGFVIQSHEFVVHASQNDIEVPVLVKHPGYADWQQSISIRVFSDRTIPIPVPVPLQPLP